MSDSNGDGAPVDPALHPAQGVIQVFGGIRPMAHKLGIAVSTVQGWKERGTIPRSRHGEIQAAAAAAGVALDPALLAASDQTQAPTIEGVGAPIEAPSETPPAAAGPRPEPKAALHPDRRAPGWLARVSPQLPAVALGGVLVLAGFLLAMGTSDLWLGPTDGPGDGKAVAALEQRLAALEAAPATNNASQLTALQDQLESLRNQVAALPAGGDAAALEGLKQELLAASAAQTAAALQPTAEQLTKMSAALDEARKTLADLQAAQASQPPGDQPPAWAESLSGDVTTLGDRVTALEATAMAQAARLGALDSLDQRIADNVAAAEARLDAKLAAAVTSAVAALPPPVPPTPAPGATAAATLALAAANLQEAVAAGRGFTSELVLLRQLAAETPAIAAALAALEPLAAEGLPSDSSLRAAFPAMAEAVVRADRGTAGGDWFDELWQSVGGLISVRPIGEVAGDDAAAMVARAEQRLTAGDLASAVTELSGLSGAAAEAAAPWLAQAKARLEGLAAANQVVQQALARLAAGG